MRKGNFLILLVALAMGVAAALMARGWIQAHATIKPGTPVGTIVVASVPLGFGATLSRDNVMEVAWASPTLPEGAFSTRDELLKDGRRAILTPVQRNEPILKGRITGPDQRASLSALLDEGKRAVTLRVDDVRGVAGFVLPGDRVDVVLIRTQRGRDGTPENYSDVLLQNVKVLAVDQLANERSEKPTVAKAVTIEVDTEQAQKVLLASNVGKISLILRQAGEAHTAEARRVTERDLGLADSPKPRAVVDVATPAPQPAAPKPVARSDATVDIVRGTRSTRYNVTRTE